MTEDAISAAILKLCEERGLGKTICPSEAARQIGGEDWRRHLSQIRQVAADLARDGQIAVFRKGRVINPDQMKGVIRLGLPPENE